MYILEVTFDINLSTLFALLTGIVCGAILTILIFTLITITNIKKETIIIKRLDHEVDEEDVKKDIEKVKNTYKLKLKEDKEVDFKFILEICLQLVRQIASRFYPKSKEPLAELTFEELSLLVDYVMKKIDKLMDKGPTKIIKKIKLSWVLQIINTKTKIESTPVVKTAKKYKLGKVGNAISTALKFLNPAMWFKKLVVDPSINAITKKIVLVIIDVIGQETYHIYSKQAFLEPLDDQELQALLNKLEVEEVLES